MAAMIENLEIARQVLACHPYPEGADAVKRAMVILSEKADETPAARTAGNRVEYTVRPVVRFFVARWADGVSQGTAWNSGSSYFGTFDSTAQANHVAVALAAQEPGSEAHVLSEPYPSAESIGELYGKAREVYGAKSFP